MMITRRITRAVAAACVFLMAGVSPLMGQIYPLTFADGGVVPTGTYVPGELGTVNPSGGNLSLGVPITSFPAGRAGMSLDLQLVYNSQMAWRIKDQFTGFDFGGGEPHSGLGSVLQKSEFGAWRYNVEYVLEEEIRFNNFVCDATPTFQFRLLSPDGSIHPLHLSGGSDNEGYGYNTVSPAGKNCLGASAITGDLTYFTTDGTYIKVVVEDVSGAGEEWEVRPWTIYFPDGRRVEGVGQATEAIYDRNNNKIIVSKFSCTNVLWPCYDDPAPMITKFSQVIGSGDPPTATRDIEIWKLANGDEEIHQYYFGGQELVWTIDWSTVTVGSTSSPRYECTTGAYHCTFSAAESLPVVSSVQLPNIAGARSWTFTYLHNSTSPQGWAQMASAEAPSGASAEYEYELNQTVDNEQAGDILRNPVTRKELAHDGVTDTWTYAYDDSPTDHKKTTVTAPDGGVTIFYSHDVGDWDQPLWTTGLVYKIESQTGDVAENTWATNRPAPMTNVNNSGNPYVVSSIRSIRNSSGQLDKSAPKSYVKDKNGNPLFSIEYPWVNYANRYDAQEPIRSTVFTYHRVTQASSNTSPDTDAYWDTASDPASPRTLNALKRREIRAGAITGTLKAATEITYDNADTTANPTATWSWDSTKGSGSGTLGAGNSVGTTAAYDSYGNVTEQRVKRGGSLTDIVTKYTYGLICPSCNSNFVSLYPTQIETAYNTSDERTTQLVYDENSGLTVITNDVDNSVASQFVYDDDGRITQVLEGGSWTGSAYQNGLRKTTYAYNDVTRLIRTEKDLSTLNDGNLETVQHFDELGRVRLVRTSDGATLSTSSETDGIKVKSVYKTASGGNCQITSNPYRATSDDTMGWTRTRFDQSGRVTEVAMFSGSSEPSCTTTTNQTGYTSTSYGTVSAGQLVAGQLVTTIEQASDGEKKRSTVVDALGRLAHVTEDPDGLAYITTYGYDVLDNLTSVDQGSVDRSYAYDSLSRLSDATNPENGATHYTYYGDGQLESRTDSRSIKTTYAYDAQGRLTGRSYDTGPTPPATFIYGNASTPQPNRGRLIEVRNGSVASRKYSYDKLGRITSSTQITDEQPYVFGYTYNLADSVKSMTYPSGGKTVVYNYQPFSGRLIEAGRTGDADYYLDAATYAPHGAPASMTLGNGVTETTSYNSRLQPTQIQAGSLLTLGLFYNTTYNNGNLLSQTITAPSMGSVTQHYRYDQLNRLSIASEGVVPNGTAPNFSCSGSAAWCQTYHYDRYGNRGMQGTTPTPVLAPFCASSSGPGCNSSTTTLTPAYTTTSNRLNSTWADYDLVGNMLAFKDPIGSGTRDWSAAYDAENKQIFFCGGTTATCNSSNDTAEYVYDGEGNRVQALTSSVTTNYVYDAFGRLAAEYTTATPTVAVGSYWRTTDHLGSTRLVTTGAGAVDDRRDLFPFGEQIANTYSSRSSAGNYNDSNPASRHLFTGKERDGESGLDYFIARYYSGPQGRFTSADAPFLDQHESDPQSWNLFAYVRNNPLTFVDPNGQDCIYEVNRDGSSVTIQVEEGNCSRDGGTFVDGTIDQDSFVYRRNSLDFGYTGAGGVGVHSINVGAQSSYGDLFISQMSMRADASKDMIATVAGGSVAAGVAGGALCYYGCTAAAELFAGTSGSSLTTLGGADGLYIRLSGRITGKIIGWGRGPKEVEMTKQLVRSLSREMVGEMKKKGLNKGTVKHFLRQYEDQIATGRIATNEQILPRAELMRKILELW